jgi:endonuclease/exonuclease/phosphatase family metal-dependent hydrolase
MTTTLINPSTGAALREVPSTSVAETDFAIERAQDAFTSWRAIAPGERARLLRSFAAVALPVPGGDAIPVKRGWTKVTARIGSEDVTVYNTHLESIDQLPRAAQAVELASILADESGRVVLLGDLNSQQGSIGDSYEIITTAIPALFDVWTTVGSGEGFTCCFSADLRDAAATLDERIDYVFGMGALVAESVDIVGDELADRASNLWPSDHAGLVATFTLAP